jgi:alpha-ribazole phosphatase
MLHKMKTDSPQTKKAITTRWWWVRHAPVVNPDGIIYGAMDLPCHTDMTAEFDHLADCLPATPHWLITPLQRTRQTAEAILSAQGGERLGQPDFRVVPELIEQSHGIWEKHTWDAYYAARGDKIRYPFWAAPADEKIEGGESYYEACARVHRAVEAMNTELPGQDIIMVGHGGAIRAAVGHALQLPPETALTFQILNLSLTRIDYRIEPDGRHFTRVITLNRTLGPPPMSYGHAYAHKKG